MIKKIRNVSRQHLSDFIKKIKAKKIGQIQPLWWYFFVSAIFMIFGIGVSFFLLWNYYQGRFFPRVFIGNVAVGGLLPHEAYAKLQDATGAFETSGFTFIAQGKKVEIDSIVTSPADPDITHDVLEFHNNETISQAFQSGRRGAFDAMYAFIFGAYHDAEFTLDEEQLLKILSLNFSGMVTPAQNAFFDYENGAITIIPEKEGKNFHYPDILARLREKLRVIDNTPVELRIVNDYPAVTASDIEKHREEILRLANRFTATRLHYLDQSFTVSAPQLVSFLFLEKKSEETMLSFGSEKALDYFNAVVSASVNKSPKKAKFEIDSSGKVREFSVEESGRKLDIVTTLTRMNDEILKNSKTEMELVVLDVAPDQTETEGNFGIREMVGRGKSNFWGSPQNRRHNISVGADALTGILIKPDEEFSLLAALGDINAKSGYLPELVIKGDKTVPEYGGGLCQIGTTLFRAVLNAGLPVLERKNHSYRVRYYEPAGTDATIYDPAPDFRFKNDTGKHLLLHTSIEGNDLIFTFWGTSDKRKVEQTDPVIYNIRRPPPTKIVYTPDLPAGKRKCTESAHNGADAYFTRTVVYADGRVNTETFQSHYRPWQEVCLIGGTDPAVLPPEGADGAQGTEGDNKPEGTPNDESKPEAADTEPPVNTDTDVSPDAPINIDIPAPEDTIAPTESQPSVSNP